MTQDCKKFTYGSVCSGIEAATVAWHGLGWEPAWFSEIESFPSQVLKRHYPHVYNLGDMTLIKDYIDFGEVLAPDLLVGGTPCQAFSVAGLRNSLSDQRGQLSLEFVRLLDKIDQVRVAKNEKEAICVWENVPGVLNTKDNAFGCFIGALAGEDMSLQPPGVRWTNAGYVLGPKRAVAWRVLDAQYFGVAQRRRRVFVVASARNDIDPAEILFEFKGVRRDSAPSREARQEVTEVAGTLTANGGGLTRPAGNANELDFCVTTFDRQSTGEYGTQPVASTIAARDYKPPSDLVSYGIPGNWIGRKPENGGNAVEPMHDVAPCLTKADQHAVAHPMIVHGTQDPCTSDIAFAQGRNNGGENVLVQPQAYLFMGESVYRPMAVRRLIPRECERLQGFQDDYTNIPGASDSARYKALGNSMAVPVMQWIGERIHKSILKAEHDADL